jgi:hypothetical protein
MVFILKHEQCCCLVTYSLLLCGTEAAAEDLADQVAEAFSSVTAELEAAIQRDEELSGLPPPPTHADDLALDWEYQLPAPPSAFRDSSSPTFSEGRTVVLADSQV